MSESVELRVEGKSFAGWEGFKLRRSLEAVTGRFDLVASDRAGFPVNCGARVEIALDGEVALTGFVDRLGAELGNGTIVLEGRDVTADLVDCSIVDEPLEFLDEGLAAIAAKLCDPFGIVVVLDGPEGEPFERFGVQVTQSPFEAIERACRLRGFLPTTDGLGRLVLTRPQGKPSGTALVEGVNVEGAALDLDDSARFRRYVVLPQDQAREGIDPLELEQLAGVAEDLGARAGRTLVVMVEGAAEPEDLVQRAQHEAAVRFARARRLKVRATTFRTRPGGALWRPGLLVPVRIPSLRVDSTWIVAEVSASQDKKGGTGVDLDLAPERAYVLEAEKPVKGDPSAEWGADVEAEDAGQ